MKVQKKTRLPSLCSREENTKVEQNDAVTSPLLYVCMCVPVCACTDPVSFRHTRVCVCVCLLNASVYSTTDNNNFLHPKRKPSEEKSNTQCVIHTIKKERNKNTLESGLKMASV
ncbi:unnamed protein product [Boreogadus saida]